MPIFLKLDKIAGNVTVTGHEGEISIDSVSYGLARPVTVSETGLASGKPSVAEIVVRKAPDSASVPLIQAGLTGTALGTARLKLARVDAQALHVYLVIEMIEAQVSSITASSEHDVPAEQITFTFSQVKWTYEPAKNPVVFGWDVAAAKPLA